MSRETNDRSDPVPPGLDPELQALHRELASIEFTERPSFAPELRAELDRSLPVRPSAGRTPVGRAALAAGLALLFVAVTVPPARAGLARLMMAVQDGAEEVLSPAADPGGASTVSERPSGVLRDFQFSEASGAPSAPLDVRGEETFLAGPSVTFPELEDRLSVEALVEANYPDDLQLRGIGGTVRLLLWVDAAGKVTEVKVAASSGVPRLDAVAAALADRFAFTPALRYGIPVGTWVEFDVGFRPPLPGPRSAPAVDPLDDLAPESVVPPVELEPEWVPASALPPPGAPVDARGLLMSAMARDGRIGERWADLDRLLAGEPPDGAMPLRWRDEASSALEDAIHRNPDNPAPFLALGRIRKKQGLRGDARRLFDRGVERAERAGPVVPPRVTAELHYERAVLFREDWLEWADLGKIPSVALRVADCARAGAPQAASVYAPSELLIAWNYLCPDALERLVRTRFESLEALREEDFVEMMRSLHAAVDAEPGHAGANVEILLALADQGRWSEVLEGAQRFASASRGHPSALLLEGMALHRLGRSADAESRFRQALSALTPSESAALLDIRPLLDPEAAEDVGRLAGAARDDVVRRFWSGLDPLLVTATNERRVEHLARAAYATLRFGGVETDAGSVWVRYGRPDRIRSFGEGSRLRTVFWDYGPGPDFTFQRPAGSLSLELTSEGRAHLDEFRRVFPHRFELSGVTVVPISAQIARFRQSGAPPMELEVHSSVPGELVGESGELELIVSVQRRGGQRTVVERRTLPAAAGPLRLRAPLAEDANRLIVELYNPALDRAAILDTPVSASELEGATIQLSDILLVAPAAPFSPSNVRRDATWLHPRTDPAGAEGRELGVLFEVYDLPAHTGHYRVFAELESLTTGSRERIRFKPAGELEFRRAWDRKRGLSGWATEYARLDVGDVEPGSYLLRIRVTIPGEELVVETTRALELRP